MLAVLLLSCTKELYYERPATTEDKTESRVQERIITLHQAGTLSDSITSNERNLIVSLTLSGPINSDDLRLIREMAGADLYGNKTEGCLQTLDCSGAEFQEGGSPFFIYQSDNGDEPCIVKGNNVPRFAFGYCVRLKHVLLPSAVTIISSQGFYHCDSLRSVQIPNTVSTIQRSAFCYCAQLDSVMIPDKITQIDEYVFRDCESLTYLVLPQNIKRIGYAAFYGCKKLSTIGNLPTVSYIDRYAFYNCAELKTISFPVTQTEVPYATFYGCKNLRSFDFTNIRCVRDYAFSGCGLTDVLFHEGIDSIGNYAFGTSSLAMARDRKAVSNELNLPSSLRYLGAGAFRGSFINKLIINSNIEQGNNSTMMGAFDNCDSLRDVIVSEGCQFLRVSFSGKSLQNVQLPSTLKALGEDNLTAVNYIFSYCTSLKTIKLPSSITYIGDGSFRKCTALESVAMPKNLKKIGYNAFGECSALKAIDLPDGLQVIEGMAFHDCTALREVTIPNSVDSIGQNLFDGCTSLEEVRLLASIKELDNYTFRSCTSIKEITLPTTLCELGVGAFYGCSALKRVEMPSALTTIMNMCFFQCTSLAAIDLPPSLRTLGDDAFAHCGNLTSIVVPEGITALPNEAFYNCRAMKTIHLPSTLKQLKSRCFAMCIHLSEITIDAAIPPEADATAFQDVLLDNVTLRPPMSAIDAYRVAPVWNKFGQIM